MPMPTIQNVSWNAQNLPAGLSFNDGVISGTPTTLGDYTIPVTVSTDFGTDTENVGIRVSNGTPGIDQYTKALLHFDDPNDPWKDECGNTWVAVGSPIVSTENAKFGRSMQLNGSSYLRLNSDITFGGKDFTVDCWVLTKNNAGRLFGFTHNNEELIAAYSRNGASFYFHSGSPRIYTSATLSLNTWYHIAIVYQHDAGRTTFYVNGMSIGSIMDENTGKNYDAYIGYESWDHSEIPPLTGSIDEFRISDGVARWTSNFTPPAAPYI